MYDRPTPNLFSQYQYNLEYESDEKKYKCQLEDYQLIQYHIIQTKIMKNVWQTVRRITNQNLGVKWLKGSTISIAI